MSWRLGVLGLAAVAAAPVAPVHRQLPPSEGTSTPAPPAPRQASAPDPIVPQDGGEGTTKMGIIAPLVIAGAIAIAVLYFVRPPSPRASILLSLLADSSYTGIAPRAGGTVGSRRYRPRRKS
jgi:hypothetical protein